jgi:hypothetical protein
MDADQEFASLEDYLTSPVESSPDALLAEGSLPPDQPLDGEQSPEPEEEVAPDPPAEEPETQEESEADSPAVESAPETPAPTVNWDSDENPFRKDALQFAQFQQLVQQEQAKQEQIKQDERYRTAVKGLVEVDEDDIDALAGDLIEDIRTNATQPFQQQIDVLTHSFSALVAGVKELPAETQKFLKSRSEFWGKMGQTPEQIESALTVRTETQAEADKRVAELQKQITALRGEMAKQAAKETKADVADVAVVAANGYSEPLTMEDYLRQPDDSGRVLTGPYGARRTG